MKNQWKNRKGVVYSTNQDFEYDTNEPEEIETLTPAKQKLSIFIDRKQRKGKSVTIIAGFIGKLDDIETLAKQIKTKCGTGGSVKNREIIIQGEMIDKIMDFLLKEGYSVKKKNK